MTVCLRGERDRDRVVARCLLAVRWSVNVHALEVDLEVTSAWKQENLRSGTSLAALTLEAADPLLPPLRSIRLHQYGYLRGASRHWEAGLP